MSLIKVKAKTQKSFLFLIPEETNAELWWDSLNQKEKHEAGEVAMHFDKISANYRWNEYETKFVDLSKSQKKIVSFVLSQKDDNYTMFYLPGLLKL